MDDDVEEKDDSKRKSRNLSEKKRRDQFNLLVNELSSMVSSTSRKMDKSTVLKSTINFLKHQNEISTRARVHEIQEDWKPAFLSNEEFTHLVLEAIDGFILIFSTNGRIFYASESITSLLGHLPNDLLHMTIYDLAYDEEHSDLYNLLLNPTIISDPSHEGLTCENQISFSCHLRRGELDNQPADQQATYELVQFVGYFRKEIDSQDTLFPSVGNLEYVGNIDPKVLFIGISRIQTSQLIRQMSIISTTKSEFTSRHSLEWKYLFLDHRAPPIIGYLPFEVLGTSGYDYYHFDDLDKVIVSHEALKQKGEGTSCYYRFLTKGQQWIWLQTRYYITYHQWNSKPEFVVCTHRVISHSDIMRQLRNNSTTQFSSKILDDSDIADDKSLSSSYRSNIQWNSRSVKSRNVDIQPKRKYRYHTYQSGDQGSDSTSMSTDSHTSKQSAMTQYSSGSKTTLKLQYPLKLSPKHQTTISPSHIFGPPIITHLRPSQVPPILTPAFLEPPQYLATIPVQPALATGLPTVSLQPPAEILHSNLAMTSSQSLLQDQLQRKHEELQQLIVHQQDELRRVSEQLLMARYGLPIVNSPLPTTARKINPNNNISHSTDIPEAIHSQIIHINAAENHRHESQQHAMPTDQSSITLEQTGDHIISYMQLSTISEIQLDPNQHILDAGDDPETLSQIGSATQTIVGDLDDIQYTVIEDQQQLIYDPSNATS